MESLKVDVEYAIRKAREIVGARGKAILTGEYKAAFAGGIEFVSFRAYTPADDAKLIDWKASLRANKMLIKKRVLEKRLDTIILLDASSTMLYGSTNKLKIEYAIELVLALSYFLINMGNRVGVALFKDKVIDYLRPRMDKSHFKSITKFLINPSLYGGKYNLSQSLKFIRNVLLKDRVLIIVSDFIGLDKDWRRILEVTNMQHDVIGILVRDVIDKKLPRAGNIVASDPLTGESKVFNCDAIRKDYENYVNKQEEVIKKIFQVYNSEFVDLTTDKEFVKPLRELANRRLLKSI